MGALFRDEMVPDIVLDDDHFLVFTCWEPDDLPANRKLYQIPDGTPMPKVERYGAIIRHYKADGTLCEGVITFDGGWQRANGSGPFWTVVCWTPLTLSPSLICHCGDHGHIRANRWVPA